MCTFKKVWGIDTLEKATSFNKWIPSNKAAKFSLRLSFSLKKSCYKEVKRSTEVPAANFMKQKIVLCVTCSHFLSIYMQRSIATMQRKFWNISWFEQQKFQYFNLWPHNLANLQAAFADSFWWTSLSSIIILLMISKKQGQWAGLLFIYLIYEVHSRG